MKKTLFLLLFCLLAMTKAMAQDYSSYYQNLPVDMPTVTAPTIPDNTVNIKDFGGVGDGVTLNTEAFAKAISALKEMGGGHLVVPAGLWISGLIAFVDNMDLHLEKNAIIMASSDKSLFIKERDGQKENRCTPMITADKCKNISITGEGTIDGNGAMWRPVKRSKTSDMEWNEFLYMGGTQAEEGQLWFPFNLNHVDNIADAPERAETMRAHLVRINNCENVLVQGVTLQNSPKFHLVPSTCKNVIIDGVTLRCPWNAQNGDAMDIGCCKNVLIVNNIVDAGDDGICMKGGAGESGVKNGPCENILIQDNTVYHAHGGFVIGSEFSGGMKNIVVRNNRFSGTDTGLRFKSGIGRGGQTENIYINDIYMTDIKEQAVVFECTYVDNKYSVKTGENGTVIPQDAEFVPEFSDIHISNVVCRNAKTAVYVHGLPGFKCVHDITIDNCSFFYTKKDVDTDDNVEVSITNTNFYTYDK